MDLSLLNVRSEFWHVQQSLQIQTTREYLRILFYIHLFSLLYDKASLIHMPILQYILPALTLAKFRSIHRSAHLLPSQYDNAGSMHLAGSDAYAHTPDNKLLHHPMHLSGLINRSTGEAHVWYVIYGKS